MLILRMRRLEPNRYPKERVCMLYMMVRRIHALRKEEVETRVNWSIRIIRRAREVWTDARLMPWSERSQCRKFYWALKVANIPATRALPRAPTRRDMEWPMRQTAMLGWRRL